jgi:chromosomal replication initiation ATPase DnaA
MPESAEEILARALEDVSAVLGEATTKIEQRLKAAARELRKSVKPDGAISYELSSLSIGRITMAVSASFGVSYAEIMSGSRRQQILLARQWAMYLIRKYSSAMRRI